MFRLFRIGKRSARLLAAREFVAISHRGVTANDSVAPVAYEGVGIDIRDDNDTHYVLLVPDEALSSMISRLQARKDDLDMRAFNRAEAAKARQP